jgi:hypothetical protein
VVPNRSSNQGISIISNGKGNINNIRYNDFMDTSTPTSRFLSAFMTRPSIRFETQQADETIVLMLRSHPITQLTWIFNTVLFMILLIIVNFLAAPYILSNQLIGINIFAFVFIVSFMWLNFLNWYFNVGIVTTKRIVDVDFSSILYKEINIAQLEKIEDTTSKTAGYFGSLFDYGNVFIQTAGFEGNIEFINVPSPSQVVEIINRISETA